MGSPVCSANRRTRPTKTLIDLMGSMHREHEPIWRGQAGCACANGSFRCSIRSQRWSRALVMSWQTLSPRDSSLRSRANTFFTIYSGRPAASRSADSSGSDGSSREPAVGDPRRAASRMPAIDQRADESIHNPSTPPRVVVRSYRRFGPCRVLTLREPSADDRRNSQIRLARGLNPAVSERHECACSG